WIGTASRAPVPNRDPTRRLCVSRSRRALESSVALAAQNHSARERAAELLSLRGRPCARSGGGHTPLDSLRSKSSQAPFKSIARRDGRGECGPGAAERGSRTPHGAGGRLGGYVWRESDTTVLEYAAYAEQSTALESERARHPAMGTERVAAVG